MLGLGAGGTIAAVAAVIGAYYFVEPGLPRPETIRDIPLQIPLRIFSRDGYLISEIGERRRILIAFEDLPPHVVHAFISAEDRRFFEHPGIDYQGIIRSFARLIRSGEISGGGSTLTQQLARDYFLTREQLFTRKLREAFLAYKIEQEFTKEQIMALFLNKMFFGQRAYGVAAAAQVYFNKNLRELNAAEAATLAGVLPAPSRYNPVYSAANAEIRRSYVLGRMHDLGYLDDAAFAESMAFPMESQLHGAAVELNAPYVAEMVRSEMLKRYGEDTYTAGYQVVTSLDSRLQSAANYALRNGLLEFTRRRGYRGPAMTIELDDEILMAPFEKWPIEIRETLEQYAPGGLSVALVTSLSEDNSVRIVFAGGLRATLPWGGISWAKPFVDRETTGPAPETVGDVLSVGDVVYVMPTTKGSWALAQVPEAQGAVVAIDPFDGGVGALTGGFDFTLSKFNRARQAYRQPGSSFKPFIYSAALEHGNTPATVILDAPVVINSSELEAVWRPINYSGRFYGPTRMREALVRSMNLVSVRLLLFNTGIGNAVRHIEKFGFGGAALPRNGSLALGGGAASPLDMAQGYAIIANGGHAIKPYVIDAIYGPAGETLYRNEPAIVCDSCIGEGTANRYGRAPRAQMSLDAMADVALDYRPDASAAPELFADVVTAPRTISPQNMFLVQDMMRDVVRRGTGRRAMALGRNDLSGKTGTSNDRRDAWFGGFNADLASIVWVGYDDDLPLGPGEEGSRTALPIWVEFSRIALAGVPENQLPMPEGIVSVLIDRETGCPARSGQRNVVFEVFRQGNVPECEFVEEIPDIFNDASGIDAPPDEEGEVDEESEPIF
ncbi:MAG: PBP1A family penicillin-binding protein [Gammaproteobacteria bacterium]|nr:PBP1A family penicillin-binding protein [Gammaproteobacteria bacterium]MDH3362098.1 PBP1A family penicillin-binding protein [Gammaproteobacteria bacterium]MDH3481623.1 PBP1A family penicillin-binding protein [Gammaproteobacteria bacterium]